MLRKMSMTMVMMRKAIIVTRMMKLTKLTMQIRMMMSIVTTPPGMKYLTHHAELSSASLEKK